ncbi:phosphotransferase [Rhodopila sp.]|uniref:phosphotransferase n=1 Tax=Rhodopila sp. TaxID=2480087 RepID=UPI003D14AC8B
MVDDCDDVRGNAPIGTVRRALIAAFGSARADAVGPVAGGASGALPYRVEIGERRYLVRLEGPASPLRNPHQYVSMRIAAEAGIAPRLYYADAAEGVAVMDFIEQRSLHAYPGGRRALLRALGEMLGRVQATQRFPRFVEYPDIVARLWAHVGRTGLFAPGVLDPYTDRLVRIRETYAWDLARSVSSHNDLVPRNILFDGERLWLIDWESAYCNDPAVDAAIVLDNFAALPELDCVLLQAWLGRAPDEALRARLALVRKLTRLYYAGVLLSAAAASSGAVADSDLSVPTPAAFQRAIRDGRVMPGAAETKRILGKMYLASFLMGGVPPGLDAAV